MKLAGKVAIITGAGSGMGAEEAEMFAAESAEAVTTDINVAAFGKIDILVNTAGMTKAIGLMDTDRRSCAECRV